MRAFAGTACGLGLRSKKMQCWVFARVHHAGRFTRVRPSQIHVQGSSYGIPARWSHTNRGSMRAPAPMMHVQYVHFHTGDRFNMHRVLVAETVDRICETGRSAYVASFLERELHADLRPWIQERENPNVGLWWGKQRLSAKPSFTQLHLVDQISQ